MQSGAAQQSTHVFTFFNGHMMPPGPREKNRKTVFSMHFKAR